MIYLIISLILNLSILFYAIIFLRKRFYNKMEIGKIIDSISADMYICRGETENLRKEFFNEVLKKYELQTENLRKKSEEDFKNTENCLKAITSSTQLLQMEIGNLVTVLRRPDITTSLTRFPNITQEIRDRWEQKEKTHKQVVEEKMMTAEQIVEFKEITYKKFLEAERLERKEEKLILQGMLEAIKIIIGGD